MYESLKTKLAEVLKTQNPESQEAIESMKVTFLPPAGMTGSIEYKIGELEQMSTFDVNDQNEIELKDEAMTPALKSDSTPEPTDSEIVNKESMDSSSAMENEEVQKEESKEILETAKSLKIEPDQDSQTPAVEPKPEGETVEPKIQNEKPLENEKSASEETSFEDLVDQYGYMAALKIKDGTINI